VRRLTAAVLVVCATAAALIASGAGGGEASGYRVDAIFDNADFLVAGQDVKIAGAVVGKVDSLHVTPSRHARVALLIEKGFAPFRSDASCTIRPESLIGEKFVDCEPGSVKGKPLATPKGSDTPTIELARNHSPVDLDIVFATLRLPYRQRLSILVNELGTGLAGRPQDLNAAIRRANPALQRANRVLAIVDSDRHTLARLIDESDRVLGELSRRRGEVASFVDHADSVTRSLASKRGDLGEAIHRLPPLLDELEPSSAELAGFAEEARPVVGDLRTAAEPLRSLLADFDPLTRAARPTLTALSELSVTGRRAVRSATPVADKLLPVARRLPETALMARRLTESVRDRGVSEGLLRFVYLAASSTARFDTVSHILPSYQISGPCQQYATTPVAGCSANFGGDGGGGVPVKAKRRAGAGAKRHGGGDAGKGDTGAPGGAGSQAPGRGDHGPRLPGVPGLPTPAGPAPGTPQGIDPADILDYLLGP
jgi:ABC-type transporter Mla subunit MlaD